MTHGDCLTFINRINIIGNVEKFPSKIFTQTNRISSSDSYLRILEQSNNKKLILRANNVDNLDDIL